MPVKVSLGKGDKLHWLSTSVEWLSLFEDGPDKNWRIKSR